MMGKRILMITWAQFDILSNIYNWGYSTKYCGSWNLFLNVFKILNTIKEVNSGMYLVVL